MKDKKIAPSFAGKCGKHNTDNDCIKQHYFLRLSFHLPSQENRTLCKFNSVKNNMVTIFLMMMQIYPIFSEYQKEKGWRTTVPHPGVIKQRTFSCSILCKYNVFTAYKQTLKLIDYLIYNKYFYSNMLLCFYIKILLLFYYFMLLYFHSFVLKHYYSFTCLHIWM